MMTAPTEAGLAPDIEHPYWREPGGERTTFQELVSRLDAEQAQRAAERHGEAICALARAAADARLAGEHSDARRLAFAASRLCEEVAGLWPRDSWRPVR